MFIEPKLNWGKQKFRHFYLRHSTKDPDPYVYEFEDYWSTTLLLSLRKDGTLSTPKYHFRTTRHSGKVCLGKDLWANWVTFHCWRNPIFLRKATVKVYKSPGLGKAVLFTLTKKHYRKRHSFGVKTSKIFVITHGLLHDSWQKWTVKLLGNTLLFKL